MYWFFTLCYCLPFAGTLAFLQSNQGMVNIGLYLISFMILSSLVDSRTFLLLTSLGSGLAFGIWKIVYGNLPQAIWKENSIVTFLVVLTFIIILLIFSRQREKFTEKRLEWNRIAGSMLAHDLRETVQVLHGSGQTLENAFKEGGTMKNAQGEDGYHLPKGQASFLKNFSKDMVDKANFSARDIEGFLSFMKNQILGHFEQTTTSMEEVTQEAVKKVSTQISQIVTIICPKDFKVKILSGVFVNVITNLLHNASIHGKAKSITIIVDADKKTLTVRDDGKGIAPDVLPRIFDFNHSTLEGKENRGKGLAFIRMVVEVSGGRVFCYSKHGSEGSFTECILDFSKR